MEILQPTEFRSLAIAFELPVNTRRVDIAAASLDTMTVNKVRATLKHLRHLTMGDLFMLSLFAQHHSISIQALSRLTFLPPRDINSRYLGRFQELRLIERTSRYTYSPTEWTAALPKAIVAIEAKLDRWHEALRQAIQNKIFADFSLVVVDLARLPSNPTFLEQYSDAGVGLVGISSGSAQLEYLVFPQRSSSTAQEHDFQSLRILRDLCAPGVPKWSLDTM